MITICLKKKIKGLYKLRVLGNPERIIVSKKTKTNRDWWDFIALLSITHIAWNNNNSTSGVVLQTINKTDAGRKSGCNAITGVPYTLLCIDSWNFNSDCPCLGFLIRVIYKKHQVGSKLSFFKLLFLRCRWSFCFEVD